MRVFVFDGRSRAALQIVRSFGRKGFEVVAGNESGICSTFFSKYVSKRVVYPDPKKKAFEKFMFEYLRRSQFDLIIPVRDDTTLFCAKYQKELQKYTNIFVADYETIMKGRDKANTMEIAKKYGVPHPRTRIAINSLEVREAANEIGYPVILKPAVSSGSRGLYFLRDERELNRINLFNGYDKYLVQEYIPSKKTVGINVLYDKGKAKAVFTYKRLREYPRNGGPSVLRESTDDNLTRNIGLRLFDKMKWKGVAMAEFKIDQRDGVPKLMEINPRFWGSLALPIFAGVDFPYLIWCVVKGIEIESRSYRVGVKARWLLLGDLLWMLKSKNKLADLKEFVKFSRKDQTYDIIDLRDPMPSLGALLEGLFFLLNPARRKHAFGR